MKAYSPQGNLIVGTLEVLHGRADLSDITRGQDGKPVIEYAGYTEVFWDEQRIVQQDGEDVYLDDEANEVLASQIVWKEETTDD
jgi:hypothetical protein